jgi:phosphoribosylglycinamide formyltransferase-1
VTGAAAPLRVAILISGRGSNMAAIARACAAGEVAAQVALVVADRADAAGLDLARDLGLAAVAVPRAEFDDRDAFEAELRRRIDACDPGLVVLAGFMRVLGAPFVAAYAGRMLNVHPSLLPRHKGLGTHQKVLDAGEREHGASVHFVTADLDGGPVVLQGRVPVLPGDDAARLSARVQRCEHIIYPRVVQWFAAGRLRLDAAGVVLDGRPLAEPLVEDPDVVAS